MEEHPEVTAQVSASVEDQILRPVSQADLRLAMVYTYARSRILKGDSNLPCPPTLWRPLLGVHPSDHCGE